MARKTRPRRPTAYSRVATGSGTYENIWLDERQRVEAKLWPSDPDGTTIKDS
jgi:hypothetical protein